jgi:hypothetical protein
MDTAAAVTRRVEELIAAWGHTARFAAVRNAENAQQAGDRAAAEWLAVADAVRERQG